jgi:hypothetical protein
MVRKMVVWAVRDSKFIGRTRYWLISAATVLFLVLPPAGEWWLSSKIGWPEAYGFHHRGRGGLLQDLVHSQKLLRGGSAYEVGLFLLLWFIPVCAVGALVLLVALRKRDPG